MPKLIKANLLANITGVYDQTRTTVQGRVPVTVKNIAGVDCLGAPLSNVIDVFTETGGVISPIGPMFLSAAGRLFVIGANIGGVGNIALYDFNLSTGVPVYVGRLLYSLPNNAATTHTVRGFKVDDTTSNFKIFLATAGSVAVNGGLFLLNNVVIADFVPVGPATLPFATGSNQKAVYQIQGAGFVGAGNNLTVPVGLFIDSATTRIYLHNGTSATHQVHNFDYSTVPNNPGAVITVTIAVPGVVTLTAHGYNLNDQITLTTTGTLPTGLVNNGIYFVRNPTANTFELSLTSGGAAITTTGVQAGAHTVRRAFGQSTAMPYVATGNLPGLTGVLLLTNGEDIYVPSTGPNATAKSVVFGTTTALYEGRISDLTAAAVTWPSLRTVNLLGAPSDIVTPTAQFVGVGQVTQDVVYVTANAQFVSKNFVNSMINEVFGDYNNAVLEASPSITKNFGVSLVSGMERRDGWLLAASSTVLQRVISVFDYRSSGRLDFSFIVTPVLNLMSGTLKDIRTVEALYDLTAPNIFYYRTSGFGSISGGWTLIGTGVDLENLAISAAQIQFKILFGSASGSTTTPAQIADLFIDAILPGENSDFWEVDDTNTLNGSPTRTTFRLKQVFAGPVPTLFYRATDLSNALIVNQTTLTDPAKFNYSVDNGVSWLALGTVPNVVGTRVRYTFTSPPGVDIRPSLRES